MELSLAWLPFEEEAIARAERMNVGRLVGHGGLLYERQRRAVTC